MSAIFVDSIILHRRRAPLSLTICASRRRFLTALAPRLTGEFSRNRSLPHLLLMLFLRFSPASMIWTQALFLQVVSVSDVERIFAVCVNLQELRSEPFRNVTAAYVRAVVRGCRHLGATLKHLQLFPTDVNFGDDDHDPKQQQQEQNGERELSPLEILTSCLPNVEVLGVSGDLVQLLARDLEPLANPTTAAAMSAVLAKLAASLPYLETFGVMHFMMMMMNEDTRHRSADSSDAPPIFEKCFEALANPYGRRTPLRCLTMTHCHVNLEGIHLLKSLHELHLANVLPSWGSLETFRELRVLRCGWFGVTCAQLAGLWHAPDLRVLDVSGCFHVHDRVADTIATIPSLEEISLSSCESITNAGIRAIAKSYREWALPKLRIFDISHCHCDPSDDPEFAVFEKLEVFVRP